MSGDFFTGRGLQSRSRRSFHSFGPCREAPSHAHPVAGSRINSSDETNRGIPQHRSGEARSREGKAVSGVVENTGLIHLTYVSETRIPSGEVGAEIELILTSSSERNWRDDITGSLLFTGTHFVQTLEGAAENVDRLMTSIARDRRHATISIIDRHAITDRVFLSWSLTYRGPSLFVAKTVARGLAGFQLGVPRDVARLLALMVEFGAGQSLTKP